MALAWARAPFRALSCAVLLLTSCSVHFSSAALGNYATYEPFATTDRTSVLVELTREAHVAVVGVRTPQPGYDEAPVLFDVMYPVFDTDRTRFGPGRHRLTSRRQSMRVPRGCRDMEVPTLAGCRRTVLPGLRALNIGQVYPRDRQHYIVVVADEVVDPYTLADALYFAALDDETLTELLKRRDAEPAADALERVLLDQPLAPGWAGLYVTNR
jgi:hypothetical protein